MPRRLRARPSTATPEKLAPVTLLQEYRAARHAADVLTGLLHEPPWLRDVRASIGGGDVQIVVRLAYPTPQARVCTPSKVNSIPVRIVLDGEEVA
jgi:hypothetical protein